MKDQLRIYADGSVGRKHAGVGAVIQANDGQILRLANRTLPLMSSNEAEYAGLLLAMELATTYGARPLEICLDSEIVINQMIGRFAVNSKKLKSLHRQACQSARGLHHLRYKHIPRTLNALADALASEAAAGRVWYGGEG